MAKRPAKTLNDELAYLRAIHAEATSQGNTLIANSIAQDIADIVLEMEQACHAIAA